MATVLNVTEILKRSDGSEVRISGDAKFYAQSNYANLLLIDVEDGGSLQANALINFTQQTRQSFTSHDFFVKPVGIVTRVVNEEIITAYQYAIQIPKLVLQNNTKEVIESKLTFKIASGTNYRGYYATLSALNTALPPTEELETDKAIAYIVQTEEFYQVLYNSTSEAYEWTIVAYIDMLLVTKQYSLSSIYIQGGFSSPQGIAPISASNTQVIMSILNDLQVLYQSLDIDFRAHIVDLGNPHEVTSEQTAFDNTGTDLASDNAQDAIKEVNNKANANEQNIADMKDGTDAFSEILLGTAQIRYNATKKIVEQVFDDGTTMEVGLELWAIARNEDSTILKNGEVAAINGVVGQQLSVVHADPSDNNLHFKELGVCTMDSNIAVNGTGKITHFGEVNGIPIANFEVTGVPYAENQALYVSVNGKLTNVQPAKPITHIHAGWILRTIGSNANIFVYFVKVPHFDHLSDVIITTPTNGDIPILGSDGIWRNSQRLVTAESEITNIKDGTTIVKKAEQDKNGNDIVNTYETKADATSKLANKVDKTTKVIGIDLQDDILLTEFKTALGNATQSVAGLLSAEDKTHLDGLVALLESSDGNTIVDTIGEILAIFNNYPEGADLVTVLNGKVDKVAGKGLSQNDFTDALKNKLDGLLNGSQYYDKNYIDALKDQNGWESELLTLTPLAPSGTIATATLLLYNTLRLQVKNTSTSFVDTDSVEVTIGVVTGNKILLNGTDVYLEIGATNSTFVAPANWELQIVGLQYTELKAIDTTYDGTGTNYLTAKDNTQTAITELDTQVKASNDAIALRELLANKATDFSVLNDTKYPTTKAVAERLLNLPIAELNNHTLREVFEGGQKIVNSDFNNLTNWTYTATQVTYDSVNDRVVIDTSQALILRSSEYSQNNTNDVLYINIDGYATNITTLQIRMYTGSTAVGSNYPLNMPSSRTTFAIKLTLLENSNSMAFARNTINQTAYLYHVKQINMTTLGISSLTVKQMDYWFYVYQTLSTTNAANAIFSLFNSYASKTLETWIAPTLVNSWVGATARYYKNNFGEIRLSGSITTGTIGTTAFTLPVGYRPSQIVRCPVESNGAFGYVVINTDGTVVPTVGSNVRFSLDGVYFRGA